MSKTTKAKVTPDLERRARVLAEPHYCDNYNAHPEHSYEMRMSNWLGGGVEQVTCPGTKRIFPKF